MKFPLKTLFTAAGAFLLFTGCATPDVTAQRTVPVTAAPTATNDNADPALWVVKDKDTTIYLFGTVHLLTPGLSWFDEAVKEAFDKSDTLVTEIADGNEAAMAPLVMKYAAASDGKKLSERMNPEQKARYDAAMTRIGLPPARFEIFDPWFPMVAMAMGQYAKAGMNPNDGVEKTLYKAASDAKKAQAALETAEQQFGWLDSIPQAEQLAGLMGAVDKDDAEARKFVEEMTQAWTAGDADSLAQLINQDWDDTPETRRIMLTDRNARWAEWIATRMDKPGTVFMAVGAGHLAGDDSVQSFLQKRGIKVKRVVY